MNPIMVEVLRGTALESMHRGALAGVDAAGRLQTHRRALSGNLLAEVVEPNQQISIRTGHITSTSHCFFDLRIG